MDHLTPEQHAPGKHGIQVQRIKVAGQFGECCLIVGCEYALRHSLLYG
jgi:hypothetical protein